MTTFRIILFVALFFSATVSFSQTFSTSGNYNTGTNWSPSGVPANNANTAITINGNPTFNSGANNIAGDVTVANNVQITINANATYTLGSSALFSGGTKRSMTFSNNGQIQISSGTPDGTLEIWGDLIVNNNLQLQVQGNLIVHGNIVMHNNAQIQVSSGGLVSVGGSVTGGNNTAIQVSSGSTIAVTGNLALGNGSTISNSGTFTVGGSCSCSGCATQCTHLPVTLLNFYYTVTDGNILLNWTTGSEVNFNYFNVEKSSNGTDFHTLTTIKGHGTTNVRQDYQAVDEYPVLGYNYYRLTSVDFDNYQETFDMIAVKFSGEKKLALSPNPFNGSELNFNSNFDLSNAGTLSIFDSMGLLVSTFSVAENNTTIHFSSPLKSGVYVAKFNSPGFSGVTRLVVQ